MCTTYLAEKWNNHNHVYLFFTYTPSAVVYLHYNNNQAPALIIITINVKITITIIRWKYIKKNHSAVETLLLCNCDDADSASFSYGFLQ